jgi:hypothetical protein
MLTDFVDDAPDINVLPSLLDTAISAIEVVDVAKAGNPEPRIGDCTRI